MAALSDAETLFNQGQQHEKSGRCADAARCYELAVALRHPPAFAPLSMMLSGGSDERDGVEPDKPRSLQLLHDGAALGCFHCKGVLGGCYLFGEGVDRDVARGSQLLRESIGAGSAYGGYVLALCHVQDIAHLVESEGVSHEAAAECAVYVKLLQKAAAQEFMPAELMLCSSLYEGIGIAEDKPQALARLQRVADQGYVFARELLKQW